jgi:group I intron endonuclease
VALIYIIPVARTIQNNNSNVSLVPVREYLNVVVQKVEILKENKGKAGIYIFTHRESEKKYIGSAKNLRSRFMQYFNPNYLERTKYMYICRAILKHGMSNFSLAIIEYCEPEQCLDREDFYISSLKPGYNILAKAGSSLGYRHTLDTRERMSVSHLCI